MPHVRRALVLLLAVVAMACADRRSAETQLTFWAFGREGEVVQQLVRDFEAQTPGVRVRVQQIPWLAAHEKLLTGHVGEMTPDVAQLGNTWIAEFVTLRALAPLDSFVALPGGVEASAFFPGIWATNVIGERVYGIPWYVDTRLLFYRSDLFAKAGIDRPPATWDEWYRAMRLVRDSGGAQYAIFLPLSEWNPLVILGMQAGSPLLTEGGLRGEFSKPAFRKAFDFYARVFRDSLAPPAGQQQIANVYQEFERGTFAMYITGPWQLGEFAARLSPAMQDAWATAPLPGPAGDSSGVSMAGGSSLVMFDASPNKEAAWRLITYLSQPEQQARFYAISGNLPPTYAAWQDSALAGNARAAAFRTQLDRLRPLPKLPEWEQIATKAFEYGERVVRGALTVEQAVTAMDADVDRLLEKRRWIAERQAAPGGQRGGSR
jgi:multiple sugar transport system substrate-binding protein